MGISIHKGISVGVQQGSGLKYEPEALALFARMTSEPDKARKLVISNTIKMLKAAGVWSKSDVLHVLAAHDSQASKLNWIKEAHELQNSGTVYFTANKGTRGNGSNSYINTNFNPSIDGVNFTKNSATFLIGVNGMIEESSSYWSGADSSGYTSINALYTFTLSAFTPINYSNYDGIISEVYTQKGYTAGIRRSSTELVSYKNKRKVTNTKTSANSPNAKMYLGAYNNGSAAAGFHTMQYCFSYIGAGLSDAEYLGLIEALEYYLSNVDRKLIGYSDSNITFNQNNLNINIVSGQSNALAQFCNASNVPALYSGEKENILVWDYENFTYCRMQASLNTHGASYAVGPSNETWGAEQPFLYQKQNALSEKIAHIKNARGNTQISQWANPSGLLFVQLKNSIDSTIAYCTQKGLTPQFESLLWQQGESDILNSVTAANYKTALKNLINAVRAIHSATANLKFVLVNFPIAFTGLNDTLSAEYNTVLNEIASELSGVYVIDANSMSLSMGDSLHYSATSIVSIGNEWYRILNP